MVLMLLVWEPHFEKHKMSDVSLIMGITWSTFKVIETHAPLLESRQ